MPGSRRTRRPCRNVVLVACAAMAGRTCYGFHTSAPSVHSERKAPRTSKPQLREVRPRRVLERLGSGSLHGVVGYMRSASKGWALLSERVDGDVQEHLGASSAAAAAASRAPRRYVGDGAGMTDEGGVGGPRGDGRGKEWTVDLCSKRLSLLHRKLRQVKDLLAKQARDPGALDEWQIAKVDRKMDLQMEISELESLRRDLRQAGGTSASAPAKKSRLAPGPFAGGMMAPAPAPPTASSSSSSSSSSDNSGGYSSGSDNNGGGDLSQTQKEQGVQMEGGGGRQQQQLQQEEERGRQEVGARYTKDGLKMASPKRPVALSPSEASNRPIFEGGGGRPAPPARGFAASGGVSTSAEDAGEGEGFDWEEGYENMEAQVAELEAGRGAFSREGGGAGALEGPAGGYPKRLAGIMSFCRVSDKATCEILVEMGRVTVNGEVAGDPGVKVDILTDIIVANGVAVTLPGKIDNSDETRKPREDEGKRTGPIPKAEKNTWKAKTKYRWNMDDGLLAKRTRRASNAKSFEKKRRSGGGDYNGGW